MKKILSIIALTLIFAFKSADDKPRIFLIGDSTCANKNPYDEPEMGWGQAFPQLFTNAVEIQNHAVNGRSTKSFRTLGHWKKVNDQLHKGDFVFIQFGHNDQKESDTTRYAAPQTDYRKNLIRYIEETQAKGATPILLTPVMRRKFDENGKFVDQHGEYPKVVREIAQQYHLYLIDAHKESQKIIEQHGVEGSKKMFMIFGGGIYSKFPKSNEDNTHFSPYGARLMANMVADEMVKQGNPLKSFLKKTEFVDKYEYELPVVYRPTFKKDTFNIVRYGAKADGLTVNTKAINQAIELCNAAGGGTVLIPKGLWVTGPIVLKSNVNLHVEKGALLQFSRNYADYPIVLTTWEGQDSYRCQAPIGGFDLENIAITGAGVIDGGGDVWRAIKRDKMTAGQWSKLIKTGVTNEKKDMWYPSEKSLKGNQIPNAGRLRKDSVGTYTIRPSMEELESYKDFLRPNMLSLTRCKNIILEGFTLQNSPAWTMHPLLCDHITVRNVTVNNPWYAQNSDAIDLESCRNGILEGCNFSTGDDGITIKSGRDEQGRKRGVPTENFIVKNNIVYHAHGGFVIGSEMSGGVRNMFISDCTFMGSDVGLRFKTARGRGGVVENIYVNNVNMTEIPGEAVLFDMYYAAKDPVLASGESLASGEVKELPEIKAEPVSEATPQFKNFFIQNIVCKGAETGILIRGLPEMAIKNINIENAILECNKGLLCIEAQDINLKNITLLTQDNTIGQIQNSQNVTLDGIKFGTNAETFLKVQGTRSKAIRLLNTDIKNVKNGVVLGNKVSNSVVLKK
ncbi:DNA sulfur modification protein DndE [Arcicella aurantiaca]|uniref:DNA sulfur modification protein DndE n=1 Tax=Arcicella aurantiaca TaxID=591202 RepID=A0A316E5C8_9BACT|nr:glycosyl hydrolase family 28 protein [Arcicella aurantiaca]PWK18130.1 DNA sulfur modification protein DndE [Arcicella aurantiaca]